MSAREALFRILAGLLAATIVALLVVAVVVGQPVALSRILGGLVGLTVLGSYALRGARGVIPRADHLLWILDFPGRVWGRVTGADHVPESLDWGSPVGRIMEPSAGGEGLPIEPGNETGTHGAERDGAELLALHDALDSMQRLPSAFGLPGLALFVALFVFILTEADLGIAITMVATILVASPGLVLVHRDLERAKQRRLLARQIDLAQRRLGDPPGDPAEES